MLKIHPVLTTITICICILFCSLSPSHAQRNKKRASLEIILSDNAPLRVNINDKQFDAVNQKLFFRDIPAGKVYVEVIKYCQDNEDIYCNTQVFSGYVTLEREKHYQAVVLVGEQQIVVSDKNNLFTDDVGTHDQTGISPDYDTESAPLSSAEIIVEHKLQLNTYWKNVMNTSREHDSDGAKTAYFLSAIKQQGSITSGALLPLASMLLFDDSKLAFVKEAYPYISDKSNAQLLVHAMTMASGHKDMLDIINSNK